MISIVNKRLHAGMVTPMTVLVVASVSLVTTVRRVLAVQYHAKLVHTVMPIDFKMKMVLGLVVLGIIVRQVALKQQIRTTSVLMVIIVHF